MDELYVTNVTELAKIISDRENDGFRSAMFYLPHSVEIQLAIEKALHDVKCETVFIFHQVVKGKVMTQGLALW